MKIKKSTFYIFCIIEIIGIILLFFAWKIGIAIIFAGTILQVACVSKVHHQKENETKSCPKCKSMIPLKARICPECGYSYSSGIREEELMEIIEHEQEEEDNMTSEEIDCNFEKIEEIAVDEITSFDGDIEEFLEEKERKYDILEVE